MPFWYPDHLLSSYRDLTPAFLSAHGVRSLLLDVDNTLIPYEEALPTPEITEWANALKDAGITFALVTNNHKRRLYTFRDALPEPVPVFHNSAKPFPHNLLRAMKALGADKASTVMVGDQLFTDMLAARCAGIRCVIVPPIRDKKDIFTRAKRLAEKPLIRLYYKKNP